VGLSAAVLSACLSLTPFLLPRSSWQQGLISGVAVTLLTLGLLTGRVNDGLMRVVTSMSQEIDNGTAAGVHPPSSPARFGTRRRSSAGTAWECGAGVRDRRVQH
jgi:uncharacterized membrane protein